MGRPLHKKYFGNTITPFNNYAQGGNTGVGGEGVASVTIAAPITADLTGTITVTFSAPQISGGITATGTAQVNGSNDLTGILITNAGSGYTSVPTFTVADGNETATYTSGSGGVTVALTSGASARQNAIKFEAQIGSGTEVTTGDIIKQVGNHRFRVRTSDGTETCKLVASANLGVNEMSITATDSATNTYFVTKITARRVQLTQIAGGSNYVYATGESAPWKFDAAAGIYVQIENQ
jgi:hypothetical protein